MTAPAAAEAANLTALEKELPERLKAAHSAVWDAEQALARVLTQRAAGLAVANTAVEKGRQALAAAQEQHRDLLAVERVLPELAQQARSLAAVGGQHTQSSVAARQERKRAYGDALEALSNTVFRGMPSTEVKERGKAVLALARRAGKVQDCKERLFEIADKPGAKWLEELV